MRDIRLIISAVTAGGMLAAGLALSACDEQGSAEKAGKEAGKRIDQEVEQTKDAVDKAKENAARLLQEAGQKAKDAADQARQGARRSSKRLSVILEMSKKHQNNKPAVVT